MRMVLVAAEESPRIAEAEAWGATVQMLAGPHDAESQTMLWLSLMRASPDVIWIVWEMLSPPAVELIHQFRVVRGHVRLVIEVPPTVAPPNPELSALVSFGIYDLVGPDDALAAVLARQPTYGDVARWHLNTPSSEIGPVASVDPEVAAAQTVAVIAGKGGVGKTSFVANCLVAAAAWGAVGIDADYIKPTLSVAFHAPDDPDQGDLGQLLAALEGPVEGHWTAHDQHTIREWVRQADLVAGVRLVPGPRRLTPVMPAVPPGLVTALAEASSKLARLTLIDTPGSTLEYSWLEAVQVADWIVLMTSPEFAAVLEARDVLRKLDHLQIPRNRVWLVINQRGRSGYSTAEIVETQLPLPLLAVIPEDRGKWHHAWRQHYPPALRERRIWTGIVQKMIGVEPDRPRKKYPFRFRKTRPEGGF
uniref:Putative MinD-like protein n=2 Tax=Sulfobacillus thermotolerans TaxID=338644 RepID=G5CJ54_9FIRM|nr:putative MinD-like protein [Sulfobacillus thermotolerans]